MRGGPEQFQVADSFRVRLPVRLLLDGLRVRVLLGAFEELGHVGSWRARTKAHKGSRPSASCGRGRSSSPSRIWFPAAWQRSGPRPSPRPKSQRKSTMAQRHSAAGETASFSACMQTTRLPDHGADNRRRSLVPVAFVEFDRGFLQKHNVRPGEIPQELGLRVEHIHRLGSARTVRLLEFDLFGAEGFENEDAAGL